MLKTGILSRFCHVFALLALGGAVPDFQAIEAYRDAQIAATNPNSRNVLDSMQRSYLGAQAIERELDAGRATFDMFLGMSEFLEEFNRGYQQLEQQEANNERFDLIEYYISNVRAEVYKVYDDFSAEFGVEGGPSEISQEFEEAGATTGYAGHTSSEEGGPKAQKQRTTKEQAEQDYLDKLRREQYEKSKEWKRKHRHPEESLVMPLTHPSVGLGVGGPTRRPWRSESRREMSVLFNDELMWQKAVNAAMQRARNLRIDPSDPDQQERITEMADEYFQGFKQMGNWEIEDVHLWRQALRAAANKARPRGLIGKGEHAWNNLAVLTMAMNLYTQAGGRVADWREKERLSRALRKERQYEQVPGLKEKTLEELHKVERSPEKRVVQKRKERTKRKKEREELLKKIYPEGYKPPKYTDDIPY
jgi:hypothetical protein